MSHYSVIQQQQEEEEKLTPYTPNELNQEWEFKIVRAFWFNTFENPEVFARLLDEEAQVGWIFLEKLDGMRVRFKRPRSAAVGDIKWLKKGLNPYRTVYNHSTPIQVIPVKYEKVVQGIVIFFLVLGSIPPIAFALILLLRLFSN